MREVAVDGGVAHECHVIERLQGFEHLQADFFRGDFRFARTFQAADDAGDGALDALVVDRALAQRNLKRTHQLVSGEGGLAARLLQDHQLTQLDPFERREATAAIRADAPPADGGVCPPPVANP